MVEGGPGWYGGGPCHGRAKEKERAYCVYRPMEDPPKARCGACGHRLGLVQMTTGQCRCGRSFCVQHRDPEAHGCTHDYRAEAKEALRTKLAEGAGEAPKVVRI